MNIHEGTGKTCMGNYGAKDLTKDLNFHPLF